VQDVCTTSPSVVCTTSPSVASSEFSTHSHVPAKQIMFSRADARAHTHTVSN
jgi:hypothetical protein